MGSDSGSRILQDFVPRFRPLFGVLVFCAVCLFPGLWLFAVFYTDQCPSRYPAQSFLSALCFAGAAELPLPWPRLPPGFAVTVAAFWFLP